MAVCSTLLANIPLAVASAVDGWKLRGLRQLDVSLQARAILLPNDERIVIPLLDLRATEFVASLDSTFSSSSM